ncbi:MAG TPA: NADH-quinone oxidoreductase subunit J [Pyrinomonadaceae bacterium]|nr:NADH-quinone oxidoreductase subunit J [Pyrinomonadaceae bacterium]
MTLSGWEAVFFWVFGLAAIFAGLLTVMARNAVHSALFLISSLLSVAALFILLGAEFIAGVQILVYVGGVMVLFLFVIMLVNVGAEEEGKDEIFNKPRQVATSLVFCLLLVGSLLWAVSNGSKVLMAKTLNPDGTPIREWVQDPTLRASATGTSVITTATQVLGGALYRYGSLPFEIASVLLLVAIIGSVMLARTLKQEASVDDLAPEVLQEEILNEPELANVEQLTIE